MLLMVNNAHGHGLSQQGVWVFFWTPKPLKSTPQDTQFFVRNFLKCLSQAYDLTFFYLHVIPMTFYKDIMPYFGKFIVYMFMVEI